MCSLLLATALLCAPPAEPAPGGFTVEIVETVGSPWRLAAGRLDDDPSIDLFVMQAGPAGSPRLQALLNEAGGFVPGWTQPWTGDGAAITMFDVDLADTDQDGDLDVVYCVGMGAPGQRFNDGHGGFEATGIVPTASIRYENELIDIDGNGHVDLVYYEPDFFFDTYFGTQLGDGLGHFSWVSYTEHQLSADVESHRRIALGDLTGDGLTDAVFTSIVTGGLRFFEGTPKPPGGPLPGWAPPDLVYVPACNDAAIADLDGDGRLDLVASAKFLDSLVVFVTGPAGELGEPRLHPAGKAPDTLAVADFDLDGATDVMVANTEAGFVRVLHGNGLGGFGAPRLVRVGARPADIALADLDDDGDLDAAVACASHVALLYNDALSSDLAAQRTQK